MYTVNKLFDKLFIRRLIKKLGIKKMEMTDTNVILILSIIVGILGGFSSVLFTFLIHILDYFFFELIFERILKPFSYYLLPVIPILGSIFLLPILKFYPDELKGFGFPNFLKSIHLNNGYLATRNIFIKIITSSITIASGGATGAEGPISQVGGAIGSSVGRFFQRSVNNVQALIACGVASGVAAQFNAPIAGVLFAQEILMLGHFQVDVFGAIVIAAGLATAISRAFFSSSPTFEVDIIFNFSYNELIFYIIFGLLVGLIGVVFIKVFYKVADVFDKIKIKQGYKLIIGSFLVGCLGLIHFGVLGDGHKTINTVINTSSYTFWIILLLFFLKFIATPITIASGNAGGIFAPLIFIGAMFGSIFGHICAYLFPNMDLVPNSYAMVGMGALLAATTHAPLTAIFLLFELTNNYQVIIPSMFAAIIGMVVCRRFCPDSIDCVSLAKQGINLHQGKETNILSSLSINAIAIKEYDTLKKNMSYRQLLKVIQNSTLNLFPVLDKEDNLIGTVSFDQIREIVFEEGLEDILIVDDIMNKELEYLFKDDTLTEAFHLFNSTGNETLVVLENRTSKKIYALVQNQDALQAYDKALLLHTQNNSA